MTCARKIDAATIDALRSRLTTLYEDRADECLSKLLQLVEQHFRRLPADSRCGWDERDVVLITYGDQVQSDSRTPLAELQNFLVGHRLDELIRTVHLLPFYPFSSDDGFAVIDHREVDLALGDWEDVRELGRKFELMFDLVVNHASSRSRWFQEYLAGNEPHVRYFIEADPQTDLSAVTRPRSLPLLTPVETSRGTRHVWTTFSADQIDLNFANPAVLCEMLDVLLHYIRQGARIIRLDAIAYLWKQIGTSCIHLPQTHEIVKLFRDLLGAVAPHVLLLTETNVPHAENVSYFGHGDEAQIVYQFSLPPLLLDALLNQDARPLVTWLAALEPARPGTTFLNFTASHDGVGVRPLEGLITEDRFERLVQSVRSCGGLVSTRRQPGGTDAPYELNISYVSALGDPRNPDIDLHVRRFLTSQGLMLSLRGIPGVYFHSLFGTPNDLESAESGGQPRRINRRKFLREELDLQLADTGSLQARIFAGYRHLLSTRTGQPAFHPDARQDVWHCDEPWLIALQRTSLDGEQRILVLANVSEEKRQVDLSRFSELSSMRDLLSNRRVDCRQRIELAPCSLVWLESL
ncbi:MAG TPA: sugar phosphorylase [Pirellulaceae bacterium]|nr:sugar phosphorylase [Pirellulaceae bacterium]